MNGSALDFPVSQVDSITFVKDTPDIPDVPNPVPNPNPSNGIGVFSVSATKQVTFSPGNLQYTQSTNTWSFASAQYEILGTDNVIGGSVTSDATFGDMKLGTALADKVDLFYWSTAATNFGVSTSVNYNDYSGSFVDWGTNQIGNDAPNTWRTLTYDEWYYLRFSRTNANDLCGAAQVNGVNGLIFLSDNWSCPAGVTFKAGFHSNIPEDLSGMTEYFAAYQTFTADQWSKLEAAGAIFLPAAGKRYAYCVDIVQSSGYYSPAERNSYYGDYFIVTGNGAGPIDVSQHLAGSVRLVKDIVTNDTTNTPTDPYNGHEYVDLGLSVKWATCNVGANAPEEYGDYFAWGETTTKSAYDWSTYKWCNGSENTMTKYCTNSIYGIVDNKTTLELSDDAARANWGGSWRMPTDAEITELREQCTWTWTSQNGVNGYEVTSKKNGKSIFLPAAGFLYETSLDYVGNTGCYWSCLLYSDEPFGAYYLGIASTITSGDYSYRCYGFSVRPVCQ